MRPKNNQVQTITDKKTIEEIFARGTVAEILPSKDDLVAKMLAGQKLRLFIGFDPTFTSLHLGHAKNIMFMEELRKLGHEIIILFGDFKARIGDPSAKAAARKQLTAEEVKNNVSDWLNQIKSLIDFNDSANPAKILYNSEWLSKLNMTDIVNLSSNFTVQQMLERDMFQKRNKDNIPIYLHEFLYPLMQGYDSVAMNVDGEICGTDQIFNALAGRTLLKRLKNKDKFVIALNLMANPKTGELMSKSNGTGVFIDLPPAELFGSIMALPDPMIEPLFLNCTRITMSQKEDLMKLGPRDAKARIAFDIVKRIHGEDAARGAEENFDKTFSQGGIPENIQEVRFSDDGSSLVDLLIKNNIISSKTDWKRLMSDGAVRTADEEKITDPDFIPKEDIILKIGKRRFVKILRN